MFTVRTLAKGAVTVLLTIADIRIGSAGPQLPERPGPSAVIRLELSREEGVSHAAISPDGSLLCLGGADGDLTVWHTKDGRLVGQFRCDTGPVRPVKLLDPIVDPVASLKRDPSYRRWPLYPLAFDPTGRTVAFQASWGTQDVTPEGAGSLTIRPIGSAIEVWDVQDGRKVTSLDTTGEDQLWALGFEPSGGRLVAIGSSSHAATWDVKAGRKVAQLGSNRHEDMLPLSGHEAALSGDASRAASVMDYEGDPQPPQHLRLWDFRAKTFRLVGVDTFLGPNPDIVFGAVVLSSDGRMLAAAANDSTVRLVDFATARETGRLAIDQSFSQAHLAFSPDARRLIAINRKGEVRVYDVASQALIWSAKGEAGAVPTLRWSGDSVLVVAVSAKPGGVQQVTLSTFVISQR